MIKYEYETGMCKQLHYNGLWSVQYEGVPGHFKKVKMVCPCIRDECDQDCEGVVPAFYVRAVRQ